MLKVKDSKKKNIIQPEFKESIKFKKNDFIKLIESISCDIIKNNDYFVQNKHYNSKIK
jgi:hypothetical protein